MVIIKKDCVYQQKKLWASFHINVKTVNLISKKKQITRVETLSSTVALLYGAYITRVFVVSASTNQKVQTEPGLHGAPYFKIFKISVSKFQKMEQK